MRYACPLAVYSTMKKSRQTENNGPTLVAQSGGCRILLMSLVYSQPSCVSERQKQTLAYRKFN